jgi:hypothetical protein
MCLHTNDKLPGMHGREWEDRLEYRELLVAPRIPQRQLTIKLYRYNCAQRSKVSCVFILLLRNIVCAVSLQGRSSAPAPYVHLFACERVIVRVFFCELRLFSYLCSRGASKDSEVAAAMLTLC